MSDILDAIQTRRSIPPRRMEPDAPGPDLEQIHAIVTAGFAAPDHGLLRPWRFVYVPTALRARLGEAFVASELEMVPEATPAQLKEAGLKGTRGSESIALIARIDPENPKIPAHEQWISVGAAMQNMNLAGEALGWRSMVISGPRMETQALRAAFGLEPKEHLVGFLVLGSFSGTLLPPPRPDKARHLALWEG